MLHIPRTIGSKCWFFSFSFIVSNVFHPKKRVWCAKLWSRPVAHPSWTHEFTIHFTFHVFSRHRSSTRRSELNAIADCWQQNRLLDLFIHHRHCRTTLVFRLLNWLTFCASQLVFSVWSNNGNIQNCSHFAHRGALSFQNCHRSVYSFSAMFPELSLALSNFNGVDMTSIETFCN